MTGWLVILTGWPVTVGVVDTCYCVSQPAADAEWYRCTCLHCTQGLAGCGDRYECGLYWRHSSLTQGHITRVHGRFNCIRQCAPPTETCFPRPTRVHIRNGIPIVLANFCTAHCRGPLYFTMCCQSPQNCPFPWGDLEPHLLHGSLGPPESTSEWHLDQFSCFCRAQY